MSYNNVVGWYNFTLVSIQIWLPTWIKRLQVNYYEINRSTFIDILLSWFIKFQYIWYAFEIAHSLIKLGIKSSELTFYALV